MNTGQAERPQGFPPLAPAPAAKLWVPSIHPLPARSQPRPAAPGLAQAGEWPESPRILIPPAVCWSSGQPGPGGRRKWEAGAAGGWVRLGAARPGNKENHFSEREKTWFPAAPGPDTFVCAAGGKTGPLRSIPQPGTACPPRESGPEGVWNFVLLCLFASLGITVKTPATVRLVWLSS